MSKILIVVDMQNDFVTGVLGTNRAKEIIPKVQDKINEYQSNGHHVIFTKDTHQTDYLQTQEGRYLPVEHCIEDTEGWKIIPELRPYASPYSIHRKAHFGTTGLNELWNLQRYDEIELIGVCTGICVLSNAIILKAQLPETRIIVDADCCGCVTAISHNAALKSMQMCQIDVLNWQHDRINWGSLEYYEHRLTNGGNDV